MACFTCRLKLLLKAGETACLGFHFVQLYRHFSFGKTFFRIEINEYALVFHFALPYLDNQDTLQSIHL